VCRIGEDRSARRRTSIKVDEYWVHGHRDIAYRHLKCAIESIVTMKHNRADSEHIISKYIKFTDPRLVATEFDFGTSLMPDYPRPDARRHPVDSGKLRQGASG
jgi:hypothetical protein